MIEYLWSVWRAIRLGLRLQPDVVQLAEAYPHATAVAFGVVVVAGVSLLAGQSVILFLNQVKPRRFVVSLLINGLMLAAGWAVWSAAIWGIGRWLFTETPRFSLVLRLIGLSYAPLAFGFLILMPYLGPFLQRFLYTWSFLIALRAVAYTFHVSFWPALICVGLGWLLLMALTATIGRPVVTVRNRLWRRLTGAPLNASARDMLQQFALDQSAPPASKGDEP
jgi:hypothetical protein